MTDQPAPAKISVYRQDDSRLDRYATYEIIIDTTAVGGVVAGGKETFTVASGRHRVHMHHAWLGSNTVFILANPGQEVELLCSSSCWPAKAINALIFWNRYLLLRELAGSHRTVVTKRTRRHRVEHKAVPSLLGT